MGVGAGGFRMTSKPAKAVNSANLKEQEICLAVAYAQCAEQDRLISAEFEATINDGLMDEQIRKSVYAREIVMPLK